MVSALSWNSFYKWIARHWKMGEHITIIGPTGSGKSFLALQLIETRKYYVLFLTKGHDSTADNFIEKQDIEVIQTWPGNGFEDKIALWPRFKGVDSYEIQHKVFRDAINGYTKRGRSIDGIYTEGRWSILIDEVMYFKEDLKLETELRMLWTQGRSNDVSLVAGTQRPFDVPQVMLNQWSHMFLFQTTDKNEIDRIARVGGNISTVIRENVPYLTRHEFLYVDRITAYAVRCKVGR